ncbi:Zn(2)-C6 fungal-type domain-containing protein [Mycena indigotica]|uniref:Zn(2)-C6 fungal-type domain-containing protein n=1 Tax=Mycena indigotica TaxID=2126181 RepID=A0A8H6S7H6_9AGAR|nr:Zn(2)-C6 fungal-type domain-containing protein [Mycena indigotica]KAF7293516.1 Zn(2)-C6 fungal-type domain-containing protein [Mycena indigotica]
MEAPMSDLSPRSLTFTFTLIHGNEADDLYSSFLKRTMESRRRVNLEETDPPMNDHRTLVLGFDGTGDQFDDDNSNVVNVFSLLKKYDPSKQLVDHQLLVPGWPNFIARSMRCWEATSTHMLWRATSS